jgi:NAD+--asparagine ADP-ribosyltransferase
MDGTGVMESSNGSVKTVKKIFKRALIAVGFE